MNDVVNVIFSINTLRATIRIATPIALAAMGGTFSERSGIINIGLEGMILSGAFAAVLGSFYTGSPWFGVGLSVIIGGLVGALLAWFTITCKANHVELTQCGKGTNVSSQQNTFAAGGTISKCHLLLGCGQILDGQDDHLVIITL